MSAFIMSNGSISTERSFKSSIREKLQKRPHIGAFSSLFMQKLFAQLWPGRTSQGALFENSRNVEIIGGQFNSYQGHPANVPFHFHRVSLSSCVSDALMPFLSVAASATDGNLDEDRDGIASELKYVIYGLP